MKDGTKAAYCPSELYNIAWHNALLQLRSCLLTKKTWFATASLAPASTTAHAASMSDMEKTGMLVDSQGMTLYTDAKDSNGMSACTGKFDGNWPLPKASASNAPNEQCTVFKHEDGVMQWAYAVYPLYSYGMEKQADEVTVDGKVGNRKVSKP